MNGSPSSLSALRLGRSQPAASTHEASAERRYPLGLNATGILAALSLLLVVVSVLAAGAGALPIPPGDVLAILANKIGLGTGPSADSRALQYEMVLTGIRLPRVVLGILAGAGLSVAGALMQGLFRNPLADPALIGVSSGASFGASLMIVLGSLLPGFLASAFGSFSIAIAAFVAGLIVTWIVYRIATHGTQTSVTTMLLAGIALNALCGAGTGTLILFSNDNQLRDLTFWSLGSLGAATWTTVLVVAPLTILAIALTPRMARALNAMLLGESEAQALGIHTERLKKSVIVLSALAVGATTAVTGLIGFVGLVVPHLIRLSFGPDHRLLLPASALLGATLLVAADVLSRTLIAPSEIPIGILTALAGAPFFLWLLLRSQGGAWGGSARGGGAFAGARGSASGGKGGLTDA